MDQSNRYADLSLTEADLIKGGKHILVAYKMKPKSGHGYLEAAAHFAAESSTGTNVEVSHHGRLHARCGCAGLPDRRGHRGHAHCLPAGPV
jgi:ribulose 1,5-bisphosphate carboxylase large subunit-like protein